MNQQITVLENNRKATYTWSEKSDSQGYHIWYRGPRGCFTTTHLSFFSVIKDCIKRGFQIIDSSFGDLEEAVTEAKKVIQHEQEVHERWIKLHGNNCVLI